MVLLFDLDGVLVSDGKGDTKIGKEILIVHPELGNKLKGMEVPVGIVTHRSRQEAKQIMSVLRFEGNTSLGVFTGNDIAFRNPTLKRLISLVVSGARKSRIIPYLVAQKGIDPADIVFIDDRKENAKDMYSAGIGLAVHVPAARFLDNDQVLTFDPDRLINEIQSWQEQKSRDTGQFRKLISLEAEYFPKTSEMFSGIEMTESGVQVFQRVRKIRKVLNGRKKKV
jgi:phosphoglycolate phosphatase-like HAD superfamily hydrolase